VVERAGAAAVWAYLAARIVVCLIVLSFAEVSTMYLRTGGPLVYAQESTGKTAASRSGGWCVLAAWYGKRQQNPRSRERLSEEY
jgi:amino acid transporter